MSTLYIYYRVREENAAVLAPKVRAMQAALENGEVLRRPESKDGQQTWMEVYAAADAGFGERLAAAVDSAGLLPLIDGPRHTETFVELPPCA
jgi:hypothetical protein